MCTGLTRMYGNDEEGEGEDAGDAELPHDSQSETDSESALVSYGSVSNAEHRVELVREDSPSNVSDRRAVNPFITLTGVELKPRPLLPSTRLSGQHHLLHQKTRRIGVRFALASHKDECDLTDVYRGIDSRLTTTII